MHPSIESAREQIAVLCQRYGVKRFDVFGSALRDDFDAGSSDLDAAIEFTPANQQSGLHRYFGLKQQLEQLLQRPVDLLELDAMPDTRLKRIIQRSKVQIYAAPG